MQISPPQMSVLRAIRDAMPKTFIPARLVDRLTPNTKISKLAQNVLLDSLTGPQLVVYIRLLGAVDDQGTRKVQMINAALYRDPRTAARALRELEDMGLIKVTLGATSIERRIEVHR